ncbi:YmfQ family protein [Tissierella carlieri]|uniref:putative phage tail protein n=1 Tax=Tissierella carlieri TaxID=689904 RepID=UPI001C1287F5|nr:putative phage tail protein [Tissierella carlieri]MBU5311469.1 YmfQ family protein [Tissierella carlieri]
MSYGSSKYGEYAYGEEGRFIPPTDEYKVNLMRYLTSNYQEGSNIKKLMQIIELELGELKYYSISLGEQNSIDKATWGLNMWEDILGIEYNPSMTLENRREIIKAKLRGRGTTTKAMIKNTAEAFSGGEVDVIEYPEEYYFVVKFIGIKGIPRNMQGFIDMLETIKPAHLGYEFKYTYTVWNNLLPITWNKAKESTWDELKVYEGE